MTLPDGWRRMSLADIGKGGLFSDGDWVESKDQDPQGTVRLTQLADVGVGEWRNRSDRWLREDQAERLGCTFLEPNDVLIARMPDPLGRSCLVPENIGRAVTVVDVAVLRIQRPDVDSAFVSLALNSPSIRSKVEAMQSGTTRKRVSRRNLATVELDIPPLGEQRRIVEILEERLSSLDAGERNVRDGIRRLRASVKAILLDLVPDVNKYPARWRSSTVAQAGSIDLGRQRHPDWHHGPTMRPYLRVANVFEDRIDTKDLKEMHWGGDTFERFRLRDGDILLNEGQTPELLGRPAIYRGEPGNVAFTNSLLRFRAANDVLPEFALLVFRRHMHAGRFRRESRITTNIAHLSVSRLKPIEFPIPSLQEQQSIVDDARTRLDAVAAARAAIDQVVLPRSAALRRALLQAAFAGQLTGRASDLDHAEELLL